MNIDDANLGIWGALRKLVQQIDYKQLVLLPGILIHSNT